MLVVVFAAAAAAAAAAVMFLQKVYEFLRQLWGEFLIYYSKYHLFTPTTQRNNI